MDSIPTESNPLNCITILDGTNIDAIAQDKTSMECKDDTYVSFLEYSVSQRLDCLSAQFI